MTIPFDTSKLPTVPPHTGWVVLRSGSLIRLLPLDDIGRFYDPYWHGYWTSDGHCFYDSHVRSLSNDVIATISTEDVNDFIKSKIQGLVG